MSRILFIACALTLCTTSARAATGTFNGFHPFGTLTTQGTSVPNTQTQAGYSCFASPAFASAATQGDGRFYLQINMPQITARLFGASTLGSTQQADFGGYANVKLDTDGVSGGPATTGVLTFIARGTVSVGGKPGKSAIGAYKVTNWTYKQTATTLYYSFNINMNTLTDCNMTFAGVVPLTAAATK